MKAVLKSIVVMAAILLIVAPRIPLAFAADNGEFAVTPVKHAGKKWRIGYYQGGEYNDYLQTLIATINGLIDLGWLDKTDIPPQSAVQTEELWRWLTKNIDSDYLEFPEDAYYTADWDERIREKVVPEIITRVNEKKDIDLLIAMGTWAGKDLADNRHKTPTMVLSTSDPIKAGIISSAEDSGYDHVHARVDPVRYERQVQIFHDVIGFNKLGMFYEDTETGRSYAAFDKVTKVAAERGFELIACHTIDDVPDIERTEESVIKCVEELATKADAIYVTQQNGVNPGSLPKLVSIFNERRIPTFSQAGSEEVKAGILMSIAQVEYKPDGKFHAETFAKVFNGAKPRDLDQVFESPPKIAINVATASLIGFDPPVDILGAADEIYLEITSPLRKGR